MLASQTASTGLSEIIFLKQYCAYPCFHSYSIR